MKHRRVVLALVTISLVACCMRGEAASQPREEWAYPTRSNLYAPPLVADVHPSPGLETIICESEARRLRCLDATGKSLWELDGGWKKRLASTASLSRTALSDKATLLLGNGDGSLCAVDAETGTLVWRKEVGGIEWGTALWADINGDNRDEAVAGTERDGVVALNPAGDTLWVCKTLASGRALTVTCPLAAMDIDGDGRSEIFGVDNWGPFCLNSDGTFRWYAPVGSSLMSAPTLAYLDDSAAPTLICCAKDNAAVHAFDAASGAPKWSFPMAAAANTYSASSIAVGQLIPDEKNRPNIVVGDSDGNLYCLSADGQALWTFSTNMPAHVAASLGDVDGDDEVEVLAASGDHGLYCLSSRGQLKWKYETKLRLMYPPTLADVDNDGKTEILVGGSDGMLRCLTLDGRHTPAKMPWPVRRYDLAQSGACPTRFVTAARNTVTGESVLLSNADFVVIHGDQDMPADIKAACPSQPTGWQAENPAAGIWALDPDRPCNGKPTLKVGAGNGAAMVLTSIPVAIESSLHTVTPQVRAFGEGASVELLWSGSGGIIAAVAVPSETKPPAAESGGNGVEKSFSGALRPPASARWVQLRLSVAPSATVWWAHAGLTGQCERTRTLRVLVNQVGYECGAPKRFTVQSNFAESSASFEIIDSNGNAVYQGALNNAGRITGAFGPDWGSHYWRGDFTAFDTPGTYRVRVSMAGNTDISWPVEIARDLLWDKTARPAYRFFYYQRCGMAIPGFHEACHLDDAMSPDGKRQYSLAGGWHDAGDYNKYHNAPYVVGLARAYTVERARFDQQDGDANGLGDLFDEVLWGGEHARRMIASDGSVYGAITSGYGFWGAPDVETDNKPGTGDERPITGAETGNDPGVHAAAMARIARFAADNKPWVEAAVHCFDHMQAKGQTGLMPLCTALDLFEVTKDARYADAAKALFAKWWPADLSGEDPFFQSLCCAVDAVEQYDRLFAGDHREELKKKLAARADAILAWADNPFGVYTFGPKEKPNFFGTPPDKSGWHVGTSSHLLTAAATVAIAYRYQPDPRYLAFIYDQFNWTLGNNPYDVSLMEGVGSRGLPSHHQRLTFGGVPRGAIPGSVVNGVTWKAPGDDRPYLDMRGTDIADFSPNEVWLPHNAAYLNALVNLQQARE